MLTVFGTIAVSVMLLAYWQEARSKWLVLAFAGASAELIDFCGKTVTADGLFSTNRDITIFSLQFVREAPDGKWRKGNRFLRRWAETNGVEVNSNFAKAWFRNDPRVKALIAAQGKLGLGPGVLPAE